MRKRAEGGAWQNAVADEGRRITPNQSVGAGHESGVRSRPVGSEEERFAPRGFGPVFPT